MDFFPPNAVIIVRTFAFFRDVLPPFIINRLNQLQSTLHIQQFWSKLFLYCVVKGFFLVSKFMTMRKPTTVTDICIFTTVFKSTFSSVYSPIWRALYLLIVQPTRFSYAGKSFIVHNNTARKLKNFFL